jgi:hypothetical protein
MTKILKVEEIEVPVTPMRTYNVQFTELELQVILMICGNIIGSSSNTYRGVVDDIYHGLNGNVKDLPTQGKDFGSPDGGYPSFRAPKDSVKFKADFKRHKDALARENHVNDDEEVSGEDS